VQKKFGGRARGNGWDSSDGQYAKRDGIANVFPDRPFSLWHPGSVACYLSHQVSRNYIGHHLITSNLADHFQTLPTIKWLLLLASSQARIVCLTNLLSTYFTSSKTHWTIWASYHSQQSWPNSPSGLYELTTITGEVHQMNHMGWLPVLANLDGVCQKIVWVNKVGRLMLLDLKDL